MCDTRDAAPAAPSASGSVISPGKQKIKEVGQEHWKGRESVHVLTWCVCFPQQHRQIERSQLDPKLFLFRMFSGRSWEKPEKRRRGMLAGCKLMLVCTYCLLQIYICWALSYSKNKPGRAGDSIWWLQGIFSFPGLAGDSHNSSWHNFMKFHSISIIEGEMLQTATIPT